MLTGSKRVLRCLLALPMPLLLLLLLLLLLQRATLLILSGLGLQI